MLPPLLLPAEDELDLEDELLLDEPPDVDGLLRSQPPRFQPPPPMKTGAPQEGPKSPPPPEAQELAKAENQISPMNRIMAMRASLFIVVLPPL